MSSCPVSGSCAWSLPGSSASFPAPYSVAQYNTEDVARHEVHLFIALRSYPRSLSVVHNQRAHETVAGAWRKLWKNWGGHGARDFRTDRSEMDTLFFHCAGQANYQRRLAVLLTTCPHDGAALTVSMLPTSALMKTEANCGLSLDSVTERASIIPRRDLLCTISYLSVCIILRSFQLCRLVVAVCIRYCRLARASTSALIFFSSQSCVFFVLRRLIPTR